METFKQLKARRGIQDRDGYNYPWSTKFNNSKLGLKNRKVKFSNEVENTKSALKKIRMACPQIFWIECMPGYWWQSFGWNFWWNKNSCSNYVTYMWYKTREIFIARQKTKVLKPSLTVLFDMGARHSCVKAEYSHFRKIRGRSDTLFSTPNGTFCQIKNPKSNSISRNSPKAK